MGKHIKYPKIGQFRNVVKSVGLAAAYNGKDKDGNPIYISTAPKPKILYEGTVKLHGTNSSVVLYPDGNYHVQSRNRVISAGDDNLGFATWVEDHKHSIFTIAKYFGEKFGADDRKIVVFGEWCGKGIQKGVAISELDRMFVVFGVALVDGDEKEFIPPALFRDELLVFNAVEDLKKESIFFIHNFPTFQIEVDFNDPVVAQNKIVEWVAEVEAECPVGKKFGVSGIGEGIVFTPMLRDKWFKTEFIFKAKGEKHSASKVKTMKEIDPEMLASVNSFVERTVTNRRCEQAIEYLKEHGKKQTMHNTGEFIRWVVNDILDEEGDIIEESPYDKKHFTKALAENAKRWWINYLNKDMGLE